MVRLSYVILAVALLLIAGCGGGSEVLTPFGSPSSISIDPSSASTYVNSYVQFKGTAYNSGGQEISFNPNWFVLPYGFATATEHGEIDGKPYVVFHITGAGTGEVHCEQGSAVGLAVINSTAGTIESVTVLPTSSSVAKGSFTTFWASAEDSSGYVITVITPTWEVTGGIGTLEPSHTGGNDCRFYAGATTGTGEIHAYFQGKVGTAEIAVTGTHNVVSKEAMADTYVDQVNPAINYDSSSTVKVGGHYNISTGTWEGLLKFDIASLSIPSYALITSVQIRLNVVSVDPAGSMTVMFDKITGTWTEGTVTWNTKPNSAGVDVGSGQIISNYGLATFTLGSEGNNLVKGWVEGSITNYGIYLKNCYPDSNNAAITFSNRLQAPESRPTIIIEYDD